VHALRTDSRCPVCRHDYAGSVVLDNYIDHQRHRSDDVEGDAAFADALAENDNGNLSEHIPMPILVFPVIGENVEQEIHEEPVLAPIPHNNQVDIDVYAEEDIIAIFAAMYN
jgi:hypothetical protein